MSSRLKPSVVMARAMRSGSTGSYAVVRATKAAPLTATVPATSRGRSRLPSGVVAVRPSRGVETVEGVGGEVLVGHAGATDVGDDYDSRGVDPRADERGVDLVDHHGVTTP